MAVDVTRPSFRLFLCFSCLVVGFLYMWAWPFPESVIMTVLSGVSLVVISILALVSLDMSRKRISSYHSSQTAVSHYLMFTSLSWIGWLMRRRLETETRNCRSVQEATLLERLHTNDDTVYGREYKFRDVKSCEDFSKVHPLTRYDHYQPYVERLMKGEVNVLTKDRPVIFGVTSGTSGNSSVLPMIRKQRAHFFFKGTSIVLQSLLETFPIASQLQKTLKFFYTPKWRSSEAGIPVGPNSSSPTNSGPLLNIYSTPKVAFEVLDVPKTLYLHLLFGLRDPNIGMLESNFASSIYTGFKALDVHWEQLAKDIETGQVDPSLDIDAGIRHELNKLLTPDPVRAMEVREACSAGQVGLARRLWPHCHMLLTVDTGTFALYGEMLKETYCKGIPIFSCLYGATEGLLGINIWPEVVPARYLLVPTSMFYEFIPEEDTDQDQPRTLLVDQVVEGCVYEMVITNVSGLCRYRLGDVIKVVGFHNTCPVVEFMYRQGQFLNVNTEKTSEVSFYKALTSAVSNWPSVRLTDYCCAESVLLHQEGPSAGGIPHYVVFLELEGSSDALDSVRKDFHMIDDELCQLSYVYRSFRTKDSIRPMEIHLVHRGTFEELRHFTLTNQNASPNQYKVPRVLKSKDSVNFLMQRKIF